MPESGDNYPLLDGEDTSLLDAEGGAAEESAVSRVVSVDKFECYGCDMEGAQQAAYEQLFPYKLSLNDIDAIGGYAVVAGMVDRLVKATAFLRTHEDGTTSIDGCSRLTKDGMCFPFTTILMNPRTNDLDSIREKFASKCHICKYNS